MSIPAAFGPTVRIVTRHLVSSSAWVNRAHLVDQRAGVVVSDDVGGWWLASTLDVLAPPPEVLKGRSVERGGPPADRSKVALTKVSVVWPHWGGTNERPVVELMNPKVVAHPGGGNIGIITLARARGLHSGQGDESETPMIGWDDLGNLGGRDGGSDRDPPSEEFAPVRVCCPQNVHDGSVWATTRSAHLASDHTGGFSGAPGLVALDLRLDESEAGSAVFSARGPSPRFLGLAQPLSPVLSVLVRAELIAETVNHAVRRSIQP